MIQKRYEGFLSTPVLWRNRTLFDLEAFELNSKSTHLSKNINTRLRLGNYVERLVFFELASHKNITILAENIQIQNGKTTLGELDCLFKRDQQVYHIEIVYKFYLYDETIGDSEIDHFIGPNRKDALTEKLSKLKNKQLPLLHSKSCQDFLKTLNLRSEDILQKVYFKAQLFLPYKKQVSLTQLNSDCVCGFYIHRNALEAFKTYKFFIPKKKDWLVIPYPRVDWLTYESFYEKVTAYLNDRYAPMVWLKSKNGTLQKCFVVWWD
ncbi:DUF1853 family protein [Gaetbulibacter aestuarii]|uniref:DUF1853 family protein n=1 Tax=Gaetbulibacter aestuarii TaxID=1502358 RepID=A0ABW7MW17_9FLAO